MLFTLSISPLLFALPPPYVISTFASTGTFSLIDSNLLYKNNNDLLLNNDTNFETNLIDIYMNISNNNIIYKNDLVLSREDITKTNINHILKTKIMTYNELFFNTCNNIKIFKLNKEIFDKSIEYLIKMDYIIFENNKFIKL